MKKTGKILSIVVIVITILFTVSSITFAATPGQISATAISDEAKATAIAGKILGGLQLFGTLAAVIVVAILGIKYMTASPEGKADYKANAIPYLVGAVLLFAAPTIANVVYGMLSGI